MTGMFIHPARLRRFVDQSDARVWVYLRLAHDRFHVYRGRLIELREQPRCWQLVTELVFHADDRRVSFLGAGGVSAGFDEVVLAVAGAPPGLETCTYAAAMQGVRDLGMVQHDAAQVLAPVMVGDDDEQALGE